MYVLGTLHAIALLMISLADGSRDSRVMKVIIIDSSEMERTVLSDFCSDLGFEVDSLDRLSGCMPAPNGGEASLCVVILGISGPPRQGLLQVAEAVSAYPGAPIIALVDREFCVDARSPHIEAIQAVVRRPVQIEEVEWILLRLSKAKPIGANQ